MSSPAYHLKYYLKRNLDIGDNDLDWLVGFILRRDNHIRKEVLGQNRYKLVRKEQPPTRKSV